MKRGIQTGFNKAFIIDEKTRDQLIMDNIKNKEIIKPILRGRDVNRWQINYKKLFLLFIPWHLPLHNYNNIKGASKEAKRNLKSNIRLFINIYISIKIILLKGIRQKFVYDMNGILC